MNQARHAAPPYDVPPFSGRQFHKNQSRSPAGTTPCAICGKPVVDADAQHHAVVIDGGAAWGDAQSDEHAPGFMGSWPIGNDCHRKHALPQSNRRSTRSTQEKHMATQTKTTPKSETTKLYCLCGCGAVVQSRFRIGHDAKLHSAVLRASREEKALKVGKDTATYLKTAPWMTRALSKFVKS